MSDDIFNWFDLMTAILMGIVIGLIVGIVIACKSVYKFDKFCPECGHGYMIEVGYCSYDGSKLKMIGDNT